MRSLRARTAGSALISAVRRFDAKGEQIAKNEALPTLMKLKTHKTIAKRIQVTATGKLLKRKGGQDHFNSRDSGTITRKKRRDISVSARYTRNILSLMPHAK